LFGQTGKGAIRGTVTDSTGAVVPDAVITVTDIANNIGRKIISGSNGNYEVPDLQPGTCRVNADKTGFRSFVASSVLLGSGQVGRVDVPLPVSSTANTITVRRCLDTDRRRNHQRRSEYAQAMSRYSAGGYLPLSTRVADAYRGHPGQWLECCAPEPVLSKQSGPLANATTSGWNGIWRLCPVTA
jgi:hypothetical protein